MKRLGTVLLALSLVAFVGCKKEEAKTDPATKPADTAATPASAPTPAPTDPAAATAPAADPAAAPAAPAAPAVAITAEAEAMGKQMLDMMSKVADIFEANKADCKKMGAELQKFVDANKDGMAKLKADGDKVSPEQKEAFMQANQAAFQGIITKMMGGAQACQNDEGVKAAMESFKI